jgi:hypothetical protein
MPAAPADSYRVAGLAVGRFALVDGRRGDYDWEARMMVEHFKPATVPFLSRHGGLPVGYLDTLRAEGPDLHFTASLVDYPDIIEQLRSGHAISIETVYSPSPLPDGSWPRHVKLTSRTHAEQLPNFRGTLRPGPNLIGIALVVRPAARMSVAWLLIGEPSAE